MSCPRLISFGEDGNEREPDEFEKMFGAALNQDLPSEGQDDRKPISDDEKENAFINLMEHRGESNEKGQSNGQAGKYTLL